MTLRALYTIISSLRFEPAVFIRYCLGFIIETPAQSVLSIPTDTLATQLQTGKSLIRIGDGEAMLLMGRSIHYQIFNPKLRASLHEIITSYSASSSYILAIPIFAITEPAITLRARGRLRIWRLFRAMYVRKFDMTQAYADAVIFYQRDNFSKTVEPLLRNHHVIVVSKEENLTSELQSYMNKTAHSWQFITAPARNAYNDSISIQKSIDQAINKKLDSKTLLLFAAGPASKALALHYIKDAIQCIDIGHGLEILGRNDDYSDRL
jgi:hypothetical protein